MKITPIRLSREEALEMYKNHNIFTPTRYLLATTKGLGEQYLFNQGDVRIYDILGDKYNYVKNDKVNYEGYSLDNLLDDRPSVKVSMSEFLLNYLEELGVEHIKVANPVQADNDLDSIFITNSMLEESGQSTAATPNLRSANNDFIDVESVKGNTVFSPKMSFHYGDKVDMTGVGKESRALLLYPGVDLTVTERDIDEASYDDNSLFLKKVWKTSISDNKSANIGVVDCVVFGNRTLFVVHNNGIVVYRQNKADVKIIRDKEGKSTSVDVSNYFPYFMGDLEEKVIEYLLKQKYIERKEVKVAENLAKITFVIKDTMGLRLTTEAFERNKTFNIGKQEFVNKYYNDDFKAIHDCFVSKLEAKGEQGLFIFNGAPGTGKTSYIELMSDFSDKQFVYLTNEIFSAVSGPELINFARANFKNKVLVIEEAENMLISDGVHRTPALTNLLNLTDGTTGKFIKPIVVLTFNTDITNIDKALIRPGRLTALYTFGKLDKDKSNKVLKELDKKETSKDLSLSEIFCEDVITNSKKVEAIGFK